MKSFSEYITLQPTRIEEQSHIKDWQKCDIFGNLKGSEEQVCGDVNLLMVDYNDNIKINLSGKTAYAHAQAKLFR